MCVCGGGAVRAGTQATKFPGRPIECLLGIPIDKGRLNTILPAGIGGSQILPHKGGYQPQSRPCIYYNTYVLVFGQLMLFPVFYLPGFIFRIH